MFKSYLIFLFSVFLLFSCTKKGNVEIVTEPTDEESMIAIYEEAIEVLKKGDAYYAAKKFKEAEALMPQSEWAAKSSLMGAYAPMRLDLAAHSLRGINASASLNFFAA